MKSEAASTLYLKSVAVMLLYIIKWKVKQYKHYIKVGVWGRFMYMWAAALQIFKNVFLSLKNWWIAS